MRVVVTGVAGSVGSRVAHRLLQREGIDVVGIDRVPASIPGLAEIHVGDVRRLELDALFAGADSVVHLASAYGRNQFVDSSSHDTRAARLTLEAASSASVPQLVVLSSAMVYGADPQNPIPLTEHAPLRPGELAFAESKVTIERLAQDWQNETGADLVVLRPTTAVATGGSSWVARSLQLAAAFSSDSNPGMQFLHLDDLATAVELTVLKGANGVFNVAPSGWVRADDVRPLSGRAPRLPISASVADRIVRFGWERGIVATPPGIMPFATHSWVVSNDRLRQLGWEPEYSNVEAYVEGYEPRPWAMVNARRRQQLAMGAAAVATVSAGGVAQMLRRRSRRS